MPLGAAPTGDSFIPASSLGTVKLHPSLKALQGEKNGMSFASGKLLLLMKEGGSSRRPSAARCQRAKQTGLSLHRSSSLNEGTTMERSRVARSWMLGTSSFLPSAVTKNFSSLCRLRFGILAAVTCAMTAICKREEDLDLAAESQGHIIHRRAFVLKPGIAERKSPRLARQLELCAKNPITHAHKAIATYSCFLL